MPFVFRFHPDEYPKVGDHSMVQIIEMTTMGARVSLLEYANKEGLLMLDNACRWKLKGIRKTLCASVVRVDAQNGFIDLSKRAILPADDEACAQKYENAKVINNMLCQVGQKLGYISNEEFEELFEKTSWYFDQKSTNPDGTFSVFKMASKNPDILNECKLDDRTKMTLVQEINCVFNSEVQKGGGQRQHLKYRREEVNANNKKKMSVCRELIPSVYCPKIQEKTY